MKKAHKRAVFEDYHTKEALSTGSTMDTVACFIVSKLMQTYYNIIILSIPSTKRSTCYTPSYLIEYALSMVVRYDSYG